MKSVSLVRNDFDRTVWPRAVCTAGHHWKSFSGFPGGQRQLIDVRCTVLDPITESLDTPLSGDEATACQNWEKESEDQQVHLG